MLKTQLKLSLLEGLFFWLISWLAIYGLGGVVFGNFGLFRAGPLLFVTGLAALLLTRRFAHIKAIMTTSDLAVWLLLSVMAGIYFPPFEYIFGGRDPGVYVAVGAGLARTGRLHFTDPQLASLSAQDRPYFYRLQGTEGNQQIGDSYRKNRQYPGLFVTNLKTGEVTPQFYPLYPVLLAAGYALGGIIGELLVTPLLAILALVAVYLLTKEIFSKEVAVVSFLLLSISYPLVWYARYPNSELPTMLLLFGGSWLLAKAFSSQNAVVALLAAVVIGATNWLRIDSLLLLVPLLTLSLGGFGPKNQRLLRIFIPTLNLFLLLNIFEGWFYSRPYFSYVILGDKTDRLPWIVTIVLLPSVILLINQVWQSSPARSRLVFLNSAGLSRFKKISVLLVGLYLLTFVLVWQFLGLTVPPVSDYANLFKLEWYLTPPVVLIGIWALWRVVTGYWHQPAKRFLFSYTLFVLIFLLYKSRVVSIHPWWVRRFLPIVVPTLIIGFVWLISVWATRLGRFLKIFTFGFITAVYLAMSLLMIPFRLFEGGLKLLAVAADTLPPEAVVIANDDWGVLATPLFYLYDREVVPFNPDQPTNTRSQLFKSIRGLYPQKNLWYYSLSLGTKGLVRPPSSQLVTERVYLVRDYQSFESLPLTPAYLQRAPFQIYRDLPK